MIEFRYGRNFTKNPQMTNAGKGINDSMIQDTEEQLVMKMWSTVPETLKFLGISRRTLYRRINSGKLKSKLQHGRRLVEIEIAPRDDEPESSPNTFIRNLITENENLREQIAGVLVEMNEKLDLILDRLGVSAEMQS